MPGYARACRRLCNGRVLLSKFTVLWSAVVLVLFMLFDIVKVCLCCRSRGIASNVTYLMCICFVSVYIIMKESSMNIL